LKRRTAVTAPDAERREIPDGAKSQTAPNPERREIPNSDTKRQGGGVRRGMAFE